jgi:hypothetical protein
LAADDIMPHNHVRQAGPLREDPGPRSYSGEWGCGSSGRPCNGFPQM